MIVKSTCILKDTLEANPLQMNFRRSANNHVPAAGGHITCTSSASSNPAGVPWIYGAASPSYFANGYACRPADERLVTAWCTHESDRFPAAVQRGRIVGVQFHPEKSSSPGLRYLRALLEEVMA